MSGSSATSRSRAPASPGTACWDRGTVRAANRRGPASRSSPWPTTPPRARAAARLGRATSARGTGPRGRRRARATRRPTWPARPGRRSSIRAATSASARPTNAALAGVEEPVTILLNPDTELVDGSLAALARAAAERDDRILAPLLLRPDGRREASAHPAPLSPGALALALGPARRAAASAARARRARPGAAAAAGRLGRRRRAGRAHGDAPGARPVRPRALPLRRGPRPRAARAPRRRRDRGCGRTPA